jgi:hypothetical protein
MPLDVINRGYGATAARLTPDQKVGSSNLCALIFQFHVFVWWEFLAQQEQQYKLECSGNALARKSRGSPILCKLTVFGADGVRICPGLAWTALTGLGETPPARINQKEELLHGCAWLPRADWHHCAGPVPGLAWLRLSFGLGLHWPGLACLGWPVQAHTPTWKEDGAKIPDLSARAP